MFLPAHRFAGVSCLMNENTITKGRLRDYLEGLEALVFDLDDTLYLQKDFKISGFQAIATWMECKGYGTRQDILEKLLNILEQFGPSYPFMFDRLLERTALPASILPELIRVFTEHQPEIALFPGARDLLLDLRKRFKLGILTDGRFSVQRAKVHSLNLEPLVDRILYSDTLNLVKPAEPLFAWFEDQFQLPGHLIAYIADNPSKDFNGAKKRWWETIRVLTGEFARIKVHDDYEATFTISKVTCLHRPSASLRHLTSSRRFFCNLK